MIEQADPYPLVRAFVQRAVGPCHGGPAPAAGSPDWAELPDDHPAKWAAVLTAGTLQVLHQELDAIEARRRATKQAAVEVCQAQVWASVAKRVQERDEFYREHPWAKRTAR
ncbi:DUF2742 domain-containing protein [Gordonia sp. CPCC 206044]|uniref:DUF2742 domain-containing protein n=1 Tax=Gordonia sp. CPCC 206044 TaxID=3140793 RepID=UPI003AF3E91D